MKPIKQPDSDRPKPINDARLAALEELSAMDQELELKYGLTGNPMIKAQERMQPTAEQVRRFTERLLAMGGVPGRFWPQ